MGPKKKKKKSVTNQSTTRRAPGGAQLLLKTVPSLLGAMQDGNEYGSIVSLAPQDPELLNEVRQAMRDIEAIRDRPCVSYVANMIKPIKGGSTGIERADQLPFVEMIESVQDSSRGCDVIVVTPGGVASTVAMFVDALRRKFDDIHMIIPEQAMSAGTIMAMSGNSIWMTKRSYMGPIDPQVANRDGRLVPLQALLTFLDMVQADGQKKIAAGQQPDWTHVQLLRTIDQKDIGDAINASQYSISMARDFIEKYKFRDWVTHSSNGQPVTPAEKKARAAQIAQDMCSHERWKSHGHYISREMLTNDIRLKIDSTESVPGFDRALRRLMALWYYVFDHVAVAKGIVSPNYTFLRLGQGA